MREPSRSVRSVGVFPSGAGERAKRGATDFRSQRVLQRVRRCTGEHSRVRAQAGSTRGKGTRSRVRRADEASEFEDVLLPGNSATVDAMGEHQPVYAIALV